MIIVLYVTLLQKITINHFSIAFILKISGKLYVRSATSHGFQGIGVIVFNGCLTLKGKSFLGLRLRLYSSLLCFKFKREGSKWLFGLLAPPSLWWVYIWGLIPAASLDV